MPNPSSQHICMRWMAEGWWPAGGNRTKLSAAATVFSVVKGQCRGPAQHLSSRCERNDGVQVSSCARASSYISCEMPPAADGVEYKWVGNRVNLGSFVVALPTSIWIMLSSDLALGLSPSAHIVHLVLKTRGLMHEMCQNGPAQRARQQNNTNVIPACWLSWENNVCNWSGADYTPEVQPARARGAN